MLGHVLLRDHELEVARVFYILGQIIKLFGKHLANALLNNLAVVEDHDVIYIAVVFNMVDDLRADHVAEDCEGF